MLGRVIVGDERNKALIGLSCMLNIVLCHQAVPSSAIKVLAQVPLDFGVSLDLDLLPRPQH